MPQLIRERDGKGDAGSMSDAIWEEDGTIKKEIGARPRIGVQMRVGSIIARTYDSQDWWQTTYITEILEETEEMVKFKTGNSVYIWSV